MSDKKDQVFEACEGNGGQEAAKELEWALEREKLKADLALLEEEKKELYQQALRKQADFDNYRKRMMRERAGIRTEVLSDFIKKLLPLLDNFDRALASSEEDSPEKGLREGLEMIYRQFWAVLKEEGVEEISCTGENFDPHIHEAVMQVDSPEHDENVVVDELQKGYRLKEKILRCSMVTVSK